MKYYVGIGQDGQIKRETTVEADHSVHARALAHQELKEGEELIECRE